MNDADSPEEKPQKPEEHDLSQLADQSSGNIVLEFWDFLKTNKKWWLIPILIVLFAVGLVAIFSGSAIAPFLYPML